jgi:Protein of unknown function (DUF1592)/Protein of unknown function (DUF1588)/Protein of unknown function (DUF1595)/Protein of unknown function (DUF1587)
MGSLHKRVPSGVLLLALGLAGVGSTYACNGHIGDSGNPNAMIGGGASGGSGGAGSSNSGGPLVPQVCVGAAPNPGLSPIRRLSLNEYATTVHDLLGVDTSMVLTTFPPDQLLATQGSGFSNNADALEVSALLAQDYMTASEGFAATVVANLGQLLPCATSITATGSAADACAQTFVSTFGLRAFRRPLSAAEATTFFNLYTTGSTAPEGSSFTDGISLVIEAMLQSPNFLYRVEHGAPASPSDLVAPVTDFEMATRLSYFFWETMPDDTLLSVAQAGQLHTTDQIQAQVQRLNQDPRAKTAVATFHDEWLNLPAIVGVSKDPTIYPTWTLSIASDEYTEAKTFVNSVFWGDGTSDTLLHASYTYANAELAKFYGLTGPTGTDFVQVSEDPTQRAGILTLGAILSNNAKPNQTSPVLRGKYVREQLLCQTIPNPPPNIVITPPQVTPGTTTRQRFAQHESQALCQSCHVMMDGLGLGFEHYDATGRWRTTDQGLPIDDSGQVAGMATDFDGPFHGAIELADKMAGSEMVRQCIVKQWFRYANGRSEIFTVDTKGNPEALPQTDTCTLENLYQSFENSGHNMRDLQEQIALSDAFRYRNMQGGGP